MVGGASTRSVSTRSASSNLDDDYLEKLITKICSTLIDHLEKRLVDKMEQIDKKLGLICGTLDDVKVSVETNKKDIDNFHVRIDYLEQQAKANSIRICGLTETDDEKLYEEIPGFISQTLKVKCTRDDINYVYRKYQHHENEARPVIVNFVSNFKRNEVYWAKKLLKSSPVSLFEDLTPVRYQLLSEAKKKYGSTNVWSSGGKIYRWNPATGKKVQIKSKLDIV